MTADANRSVWDRLVHPLSTRYRSAKLRRRSNIAWAAAGIGIAILFAAIVMNNKELLKLVNSFMPRIGSTSSSLIGGSGGSLGLIALAKTFYEKVVVAGRKSVGSIINDPEKAAREATLAEAKEELTTLISQAVLHMPNFEPGKSPLYRAACRFVTKHPRMTLLIGKNSEQVLRRVSDPNYSLRRFVIVVDDIERVEPPKGISILEAISQLLSDAPVVVLILGDMRMIGAAAGMKYEALGKALQRSEDPQYGRARQLTFGSRYLQKIVQLQFDLPSCIQMHDSLGASGQDRVLLDYEENKNQRLSVARLREIFRKERLVDSSTDELRMRQRRRANLVGFRILNRIVLIPLSMTLLIAGVAWAFDRSTDVSGWWAAAALCFVASTFAEIRLSRSIVKISADIQGLTLHNFAESLHLTGDNATRLEAAVAGARSEVAEIQTQLNDNQRIREARERALGDLSWSPRAVKRIENALRVYCVIAEQSNLLDDHFTVHHLGKWIGLRERWPRLAQEALIRHKWFESLEQDPMMYSTQPATPGITPRMIDEVLDGVETTEEQRDELALYLTQEPALWPIFDLITSLPNRKGPVGATTKAAADLSNRG